MAFPTFRPRDQVGMAFCKPSRAVQDAKDECDVNLIMAKYSRTGLIKHREQSLIYGDFSQVTDYHTAQNIVANARSMFEGLPSNIREKFENDPGKFLAFASDEKNLEEMYELGLKARPPAPSEPPPPIEVKVVNQAPEAPK